MRRVWDAGALGVQRVRGVRRRRAGGRRLLRTVSQSRTQHAPAT